ncbi:MAG: prenyltransferase/squalene oxidase repeat-containing protein [Planctomycetota bacterium]
MRRIVRLAIVLSAWVALSGGAAPSPPAPGPEEIEGLVRLLGDNDFHAREAAGRALRGLGEGALPPLEKAKASADPEIRSRAEELVAFIRQDMAARAVERRRESERAWLKKNLSPLLGASVPEMPPAARPAAPAAARPAAPASARPASDGSPSLDWLAAHQEPDGRFDSVRYGARSRSDVAQTALSLLAFLGAGHTDETGVHQITVRKGLVWLRNIQRADGAFVEPGERAPDGLSHALAALSMAEAFGMSGRDHWKSSAQIAVDYSVRVHLSKDRMGRHRGYGRAPNSETPDLLTTAFFLMHLTSARIADLRVDPEAFQGIKRLVEELRDPDLGEFRLADGLSTSPRATTAGCFCIVMLGANRDALLSLMENALDGYGTPTAGEADSDAVFNYFATLSAFYVFGAGGFNEWNASLRQRFRIRQRTEGDEAGSWDPSGEWKDAGRVLATALNALCLEVYYRYLPVYKE